ncbi:MAG: hypothetical protein KC800_31035 [Candidatus Eremiobacteraeota bacterium]|nr:hypothetical protein [Candidatus Eremiobacteraeota bacterium]
MNISSSNRQGQALNSTTLQQKLKASTKEQSLEDQGNTWDVVSLISRTERESGGPLSLTELKSKILEKKLGAENRVQAAVSGKPTATQLLKEHALGLAIGAGGTLAVSSPLLLLGALGGQAGKVATLVGVAATLVGFQGSMAMAEGSWAERREANKELSFNLQQVKQLQFAEQSLSAFV